MSILWLAYGRHLARPRMEQDAPGHRVAGLGFVRDYHLTFRAVPSVPGPSLPSAEAAPHKRLAGLLYHISYDEWEHLKQLHLPSYAPYNVSVLPLGSRSTAITAQWFLPLAHQEQPPLGGLVYQVFNAARILPGYPGLVLQELEQMALTLRPGL
jgi:hypothetical protein